MNKAYTIILIPWLSGAYLKVVVGSMVMVGEMTTVVKLGSVVK